jgi:hypothetical protein
MLLTQLELRGWEGLHVDGWAVGALLVRNLLLVVLFALLARELRSPSAPPVAAAVTRESGP